MLGKRWDSVSDEYLGLFGEQDEQLEDDDDDDDELDLELESERGDLLRYLLLSLPLTGGLGGGVGRIDGGFWVLLSPSVTAVSENRASEQVQGCCSAICSSEALSLSSGGLEPPVSSCCSVGVMSSSGEGSALLH